MPETKPREIARTYPVTVAMETGPAGDRSRPTTILLCWTEADPATAAMTIADPWTEDGTTVEWLLSRSLLVGAHVPAFVGRTVGMGDAQVRYGGASTTIHLGSPEGRCVLTMRGEVLKDFLRATAEILPFGHARESEVYDAMIEADLAELFGGTE